MGQQMLCLGTDTCEFGGQDLVVLLAHLVLALLQQTLADHAHLLQREQRLLASGGGHRSRACNTSRAAVSRLITHRSARALQQEGLVLTEECGASVVMMMEECRTSVVMLMEECGASVVLLMEECRTSVVMLTEECRTSVEMLMEECGASVVMLMEECGASVVMLMEECRASVVMLMEE